ncbi:protein NO VEIN domain-containing protein [Paenibacillus sp. 23TSA30-6]|uniref:protein NO VEIN domain-containing protein n=1 Tax=Paenibacillus sp. 23TSA30-6 TaxID=2546104 RepID=UPI001787CFB3|nr:DUF3883 domain-containing protein [Paenibacillus sp. 23TSA30-6]MBE0338716.1 DUF3883 domain-containing protein [Paenibacillus sp. 23TSA30-6]
MSFSVGILYSSQSFLELVKENELNGADFPGIFTKYVVADSRAVLNTTLECKWVILKENNLLKVTAKGDLILNAMHPYEKLRIQIADIIEVTKPSWAPLIGYGRSEAVKYFSEEVLQCFKEAYLLEGYEQKVIEWWDKLAIISRGLFEDVRLEVGRKGETLSRQYEKLRIGVDPIWQAIESNFSGYDLLSQIDEENSEKLKIEVKATTSKTENISITITKLEWNVAKTSERNYIFHIWTFYPKRELFILTQKEMSTHIPINQGNGVWESVEIIFSREHLKQYKSTDIF